MNRTRHAAGIAVCCCVALAAAQTADRKTLTLDGAKQVLAACEAEAKKNTASGAIAVVDDGGNLIALYRLDGTFAAAANISIGKARTSAIFKKPTRAFEDIIRNGRTAMLALPDFTPLQGGVPIVVAGEVVGAVGVSGASSQQQDEDIAIAGAKSLGGTAAAHAPVATEVSVFDRAWVATAPGEVRDSAHDGGEARTLGEGDAIIVPRGVRYWLKEVQRTLLYYVAKLRS